MAAPEWGRLQEIAAFGSFDMELREAAIFVFARLRYFPRCSIDLPQTPRLTDHG